MIFEPADAVAFVDAVFTLRHDSFQIMPANLLKEILPASLDMLGVEDSNTCQRFLMAGYLSDNQTRNPRIYNLDGYRGYGTLVHPQS